MMLEQKTSEVRLIIEEHICVISLDNTLKKNAITPELMSQLSAHLTSFEDDDNLWVAIIDPAGEHTTAGLDMPKFFGPATAKPIPKWSTRDEESGADVPRAGRAGGGRGHSVHPECRLRHRGFQGRHSILRRTPRSALPGALNAGERWERIVLQKCTERARFFA